MSGVKPRSVREMVGAPGREPSEGAEPSGDRQVVTLELDGRAWEACAVGSTDAARRPSSAPLLLVRFTPLPDSAGGPDTRPAPEEALESWVVGASLDEVPRDRLLDALGRARPWSADPPRKPFFEDVGGRRGR